MRRVGARKRLLNFVHGHLFDKTTTHDNFYIRFAPNCTLKINVQADARESYWTRYAAFLISSDRFGNIILQDAHKSMRKLFARFFYFNFVVFKKTNVSLHLFCSVLPVLLVIPLIHEAFWSLCRSQTACCLQVRVKIEHAVRAYYSGWDALIARYSFGIANN